MAQIQSYGPIAHLRSEASTYVIRYRKGRIATRGRGLSFWFRPPATSIAEVPMEDRETNLFVKGRSQDFQQVNIQGALTWQIVEPERLADRVDFSVALNSGRPIGEPIERIESRLRGLVGQVALEYLSELPVRALLDAGIEPLRQRLETALAGSTAVSDLGLAVVAVRLIGLAPTSELERALQTPTFESLQQKADEATFERRALAVEKERAIAENELATKVELARREKLLITEEAENARARAQALAEAQTIEAEAESARIRAVETAKAEGEEAHVAVYRDLPPGVLLGFAARELAGKLTTIEHVNITPDLLGSLVSEVRRLTAPPASPAS